MNAPKITLRIGRIVVDHPGLTRKSLQAALHAEISTLVENRGTAGLGPARSRETASGRLAPGEGALPTQVAAAAMKAVIK